MRRILILIALLWGGVSGFAQENKTVVGAYVAAWTDVVPDPHVMTHLFYAFGGVNETFNGVDINRPERLRMIAGLKAQNPDLKILLSVGGWKSGRFSEMVPSHSLTKRSCTTSFASSSSPRRM